MVTITVQKDKRPRRRRTMVSITPQDIEKGGLQEGETLDFKRIVVLEKDEQKAKFIDSIVAFLNRGEARIIVGVEESGGRFLEFRPLRGDADQLALQMQSLIQDSVRPTPFDVAVVPLHVADGFLLDIQIPRHVNGPFMNSLNGAYLLRTGVRNRPIDPGTLRSRFVDEAIWVRECQALTEKEDEKLDQQGRLVAARSIRVGILPQEYFDHRRSPFSQEDHVRSPAPSFGDRGGQSFFKACEDGHEAFSKNFGGDGHFRLFVRDDWFIHARISWALQERDGGQLALFEFQTDAEAFLKQMSEFLASEEIEGPFAVSLALLDLHADDRFKVWFPNNPTVRLLRPMIVPQVDDPDLVEAFLRKVRHATIFG
ncbi:MAG TPA: ATP-binding protein [Allosphingosinicella sp.]|jgi:hypothetical protein